VKLNVVAASYHRDSCVAEVGDVYRVVKHDHGSVQFLRTLFRLPIVEVRVYRLATILIKGHQQLYSALTPHCNMRENSWAGLMLHQFTTTRSGTVLSRSTVLRRLIYVMRALYTSQPYVPMAGPIDRIHA
jgi:hypothetical protein